MRTKKDAEILISNIMDQINDYYNYKPTKMKSSTKAKGRPAKNPTIHKNKKATCKYCKGDDFFWGETEWGLRLFDTDNAQHMWKDQVKNGQAAGG